MIPNDTGWFVTNSLVFSLYKNNQISEIYKLLGNDIDAEDMRATVLALYAFLEYQKGNTRRAKEYFERAKINNFDKKKFERQFMQFGKFNANQKKLLETTINGLSKIGDLN